MDEHHVAGLGNLGRLGDRLPGFPRSARVGVGGAGRAPATWYSTACETAENRKNKTIAVVQFFMAGSFRWDNE